MPETNIRDDIDRVRDRVWNNALKVCTLEHYYTGTFCFPLGPEFGCGSAINITKGESRSLSGKFGGGGAEVGASVTYTASTAWSHTSGRCEWCTPTVCYPNSTMEVWECESFLDYYSWTSEFVRFNPGRAQITPNCARNDEKCNCKASETQSMVPSGGEGGYAGTEDESKTAVVVRTTGFIKREGDGRTDPREDLKEAANHIEALADAPGHSGCKSNKQVFVELPDGQMINLTDSQGDELAVLSMSHCGNGKGMVKVQRGQLVPVLAIGPGLDTEVASVQLRRFRNGNTETLLTTEAPVKTGVFTTIWKELVLPKDSLEAGEKGEVLVCANDEHGRELRSCVPVFMPFQVPEKEAGVSTKTRKKGSSR